MPTLSELDLIKRETEKLESLIRESEKKVREGIAIGIDLSLSCPAVAVVNLSQNKVLYIDKYKKKGDPSIWIRLSEIRFWLERIIDTFRPEIIIIEGAFMSKFTAKSNESLYKAHGYIGHFLKLKGARVIASILPSSSRAFLKIKPNTKEQAFTWVQQNFPELNLSDFKKDNDLSDAIIVALNALNKKGIKEL
ncbi:MAG: hypothetical protein ACRCX2_35665 [Paraclostridium sp.]